MDDWQADELFITDLKYNVIIDTDEFDYEYGFFGDNPYSITEYMQRLTYFRKTRNHDFEDDVF